MMLTPKWIPGYSSASTANGDGSSTIDHMTVSENMLDSNPEHRLQSIFFQMGHLTMDTILSQAFDSPQRLHLSLGIVETPPLPSRLMLSTKT